MKNSLKLFGAMRSMAIIALVAVIGFSMAACSNGSTGGGGGGGGGSKTPTDTSITYTGKSSDGSSYSLIITQNTGRAAYAPKKGDSYELTVSGKKSTGSVETFSGGVFTLKPSNSATTFKATVSGSNLSNISGTITLTDTEIVTGPGKLTPANTLIVINIADVPDIKQPITGITAVTSINTTQYTGTVLWSPAIPSDGKFAAGIKYTATITLTAKTGFTLQGVKANFFKVHGAASVTNAANSGVITAVFPAASTPTLPTNITGNMGNYRFGHAEDGVSTNYSYALWELKGTALSLAKTTGTKLVLGLNAAPSVWVCLAWQGPGNEIWWGGWSPIHDGGKLTNGATWASGKLTIPLSLVDGYSNFRTQPSLNLIIFSDYSNINELGITSANLVP
jgi:hypothetical protein